MQSRRYDEYTRLSPASKARNHRRFERDQDSYLLSRRHRSPPRSRRSLSPYKTDGARRILPEITERRDYGWHSGHGRTEKVRSGSPTHLQPPHKRAHFDEGVVRGVHNYIEDMGFDDGKNSRWKHAYEYGHVSKTRKEKDYGEKIIAGVEGHGVLRQKSTGIEDPVVRRSYPLPNYAETGGHLQLSSRSIDIGRFDHEQLRYQEPLPTDNLVAMPYYKGEKPAFPSRDIPYSMIPESHSRDFVSTTHSKDFVGTSSGISRSEILGSYRDGLQLHASDEIARVSGTLTKPMGFAVQDRRPHVGCEIEPEAVTRKATTYPHGAYNPNRVEQGYFCPKSQGPGEDDRGYLYDKVNNVMLPRTQPVHDHSQMEYDQVEFSRKTFMHSVGDRIDSTEDSFENLRNSSARDHPTLPNLTISNDVNSSGPSYALDQGWKFRDSQHSEFDRRTERDYELSIPENHPLQNSGLDYSFGRDFSLKFHDEEPHSHSVYDLEMDRISARRHRAEEQDRSTHNTSDKMLHGRHNLDEDIMRHDPRTIMSRKWNILEEFEDLCDSDEEWIDEDMSGLPSYRNRTLVHSEYRETGKMYDGPDHPRDFTSDGWLPSQDSWENAHRHPVRNYKSSGKHVKDHSRSGSLRWYNSPHALRSGIREQQKVWKRNYDNDEVEHANDPDSLEYFGGHAKFESSEDTEKFKQLVHEAFLRYYKRLNVNLAVRRRYKEQGKAGSLYCIVCGRSLSKEFMDTKRLVMHAFMSHKVGLRAEHWGLHRAICILMGWDTVPPQDTVTWVPEVLPASEAWAQKEDLILWPPVVIIHNISMSNNNPEQQKVLPIERIETFLRGQGFVGVKMKVCLGKPADQSVMIVKFLGTFSGLGSAERIHKYFADKNHGRVEFERKTSRNKSSSCWDAGMQGNKVEEHLLYGYMGIADDLDRLDFNTKNRVLIKSKKEILDLANSPVEPAAR
ncbi:hypothetical protein HS088_TW16G00134 [Tripterygium wilfordii]|uniref:XS domain-containing protein n=1 Tax=Tripterygium wilfordii TaxID=458696 RepID=A0A7J7CI26_TRIWF|nr:uncharacterized protein LOC119980987 [Tripterygium wilfordii]KAF5733694.1 hypothetical protein HS088_TW16G00134 [Tripterygium wilfordii]